ncbi:MAG TPA: hypothetical protein ENH60_07370 [Pricia sp.]|nr:hypothetical protein [Pricia sp.]
MKKTELIEKLKQSDVEFDENAKYNDLAALLPKSPEILTTETIMEPPPPQEKTPASSQSCGTCRSYGFVKTRGFMVCTIRGGRRKNTEGGSCKFYGVNDG